jgi:hypothetical protein
MGTQLSLDGLKIMTVEQLIELLQKQDPNAKVFFQTGPYEDEKTSVDEVFEDNANGVVILL